jgi:hypothetical protein
MNSKSVVMLLMAIYLILSVWTMHEGDWRRSVYWACACVISYVVTF